MEQRTCVPDVDQKPGWIKMCAGAWDRTGRGQIAGNRPGDGDEDQGFQERA
jgi:hypothetical protein